MPQSLAKVLLHLVLSTKNRRPFLKSPALRESLHGYVVGIFSNLKRGDAPSGLKSFAGHATQGGASLALGW